MSAENAPTNWVDQTAVLPVLVVGGEAEDRRRARAAVRANQRAARRALTSALARAVPQPVATSASLPPFIPLALIERYPTVDFSIMKEVPIDS